MSELTIEVSRREAAGSNANRRLRREGTLPGVLYGGGKESVAIQLDRSTLHSLMKEGGENAVFLLKLSGSKDSRHAMVRDMDVDPAEATVGIEPDANGETLDVVIGHPDFAGMDETLQLQAAFQANARVMVAVDRLLEEVLGLV